MMRLIICLVEIVAIIQCIHCVYGERIKYNTNLILTYVAIMTVSEIVNTNGGAILCSFVMYVVLVVYCVKSFHRSWKHHIINTVLYMIVITIVQFLCGILLFYIIRDGIFVRNLCANILSAVFCILVLPKFELQRISEWAAKRNIVFCVSLIYIFVFVCIMLLQVKLIGRFEIKLFIFFAPFVLIVLLMYQQWEKYQRFYEQKDLELSCYVEDKEKSAVFLKELRLRLHEVKNHIMAINAMHYTISSYDELVREQKKYLEQITYENKYNSLIALHSSVLMGFLYEKFNFIEDKGICVECFVKVSSFKPVISEYYLVEMLGGLLDNATEAVQYEENKVISIEIKEEQNEYEYIVRNPYPYTTYEEIITWFDFEKSKKGIGRGLGLYHLKCTCQEWNCSISCNNIEREGINWIEFKIGTGRKA